MPSGIRPRRFGFPFSNMSPRAPTAPIGQNLARDPGNLPAPNTGCAMQRNFAAMIEDPQDLLYPRNETPRPGERRDVVWGKYVEGQPTLSKRDPSEHANASEISRIGGE